MILIMTEKEFFSVRDAVLRGLIHVLNQKPLHLELQVESLQEGREEQSDLESLLVSVVTLQAEGNEKNLCRAEMLSSNVFTAGSVLGIRSSSRVYLRSRIFTDLSSTVMNCSRLASCIVGSGLTSCTWLELQTRSE